MKLNKEKATEELNAKCSLCFGCDISEATEQQIYKSLCMVLRDILSEKNNAFNRNVSASEEKQVYYMSMEFLVGTSLHNNLFNLGIEDTFKSALADIGVDIEKLYEIEPDAGLGNGGLGRLASCYMDSASSLGYPVTGFSIRYEFGVFKQKIVDGWQMEFPDDWLGLGDVWLTPRTDESVEVRFGGQVEETWTDGKYKAIH